jgi:hypothetical protein
MDAMDDRSGFFRQPKWQIFIVIVLGLLLYIYLTYRLGGAQANLWSILIDLVLFYGGILFWMFFFAQFTLPVQDLKNRLLAFNRLLDYLFGKHGAAIFIENGEVLKHAGEMDRNLPGIALLDTASAAVFRTDVEFTRAVGPGIVFNQVSPNSGLLEQIREGGTVDLHRQSQFFGPKEDEDPFKEKGENESQAAYAERQRRRWQTSGRTRDGIEVIPNIIVAFQLDSVPGEGHTQFGYNETAVFRALTSSGIDPDLASDNPRKNFFWNELPGYLAGDVWREVVGKFTLDDLFRDLPADIVLPGTTDRSGRGSRKAITGLEFLNTYLRQRMTQEEVSLLDAYGRVVNKVPSAEYRQLKDRGIKVTGAFVVNLRFERAIEEELKRRWKSTWKQRAMAERAQIEEEITAGTVRGQTRALQDYSRTVGQSLARLSAGIAHDSTEILMTMAKESLSQIARPSLSSSLDEEKQLLIDLINWLEKRP